MRRGHYNTEDPLFRMHAEQDLRDCFSLGRRLIESSLVSAEGLAESLIQRVNPTSFGAFNHGAEYMGNKDLDVSTVGDQGFLEHPYMMRRSSGCWFDRATVMYHFAAPEIGAIRGPSTVPATPEQTAAFLHRDRIAERVKPPVMSAVPLPLQPDSVRRDSGVIKLEELPQNLTSVPPLDGEWSQDESCASSTVPGGTARTVS